MLPSYELRDQPLSQVVPKMYDPSNVFDDASHDHENRNPQVQRSGAQIPKDTKVILHQSTSHYITTHVSVSLLLR